MAFRRLVLLSHLALQQVVISGRLNKGAFTSNAISQMVTCQLEKLYK